MKMKRLLFVVFLIMSLSGKAQLQNTYFHTFDARKMGVNTSGYQTWDETGRMWSVTDEGLVIFDGYNSEVIPISKNENGVLSDKIRFLYKIKEDEFWITYSDQKNYTYFNPLTKKFNHLYSDTSRVDGMPPVDLTKIIYENDSIRWFATWGEGICRINVKTGSTKVFKNDNEEISEGEPPVNFVRDIAKIEPGKWLCGFFFECQYATPYYFYPEKGVYEKIDIESYMVGLDEKLKHIIRLGLGIANFVHVDEKRNFWIGSYIGLFHIDNQNKTIRRITHPNNDIYRQNLENTRNYYLDKNGNLWIGTPNQGVIVVNPKNETFHQVRYQINSSSSLVDDRILTINGDPQDNIWIATSSGNFSIYNPLLQKFNIYPWAEMSLDFSDRSVQQIPVNQILVLPSGAVIITSATGITIYHPKEKTTETIYSKKDFKLFSSSIGSGVGDLVFRDSTLYFGFISKGPNITNSLDLKSGKKTNIFTPQSYGQLLFRHSLKKDAPIVFYKPFKDRPLIVYNSHENTYSELNILPDSSIVSGVFSILLDDESWMIPFKNGSIMRYYTKSKISEIYHHKNQDFYFPDSSLNCAYNQKGDNIWLGTQTGIYQYSKSKKTFKKYNSVIGLKDIQPVNSITMDSTGVLWFTSNKELFRWNEKENDLFNFNSIHGLNVGNFFPAEAQQDNLGNIYIACYNGILQFNPYDLSIPKNELQLYLSSGYLHDKKISTDTLLNEHHIYSNNENFFSFEFYTNQIFTLAPHKFYYKLLGRDTTWIANGNNHIIRLEDLSFGNYTLQVKCVDIFGNESNEIQIPVNIDKPYYLKTWFILVVVFVLILIIYGLIKYREKALRKKSEELEKIVEERTAEVVLEKKEAERQRIEAEHQKELVEEKQKEITDSIAYAKRIQNAILPSDRYFQTHLPESFIFYLPKDVVAGDFYFMEDTTDYIFLAVGDCTGHGVPGAMVSVVCHNALSRSVKEFNLVQPDEILNKTRELVIETFSKSEDQVNDGMDIAFCTISKKDNSIIFSGANNGLYLIQNNELIEFKPDKQPIGKFIHARPFNAQKIQLNKGERVYLFSDGYADQFGGEEGKPGGKKFKYSRLKKLLIDIHSLPIQKQKQELSAVLKQWKGDFEQVDDICIIGFSI